MKSNYYPLRFPIVLLLFGGVFLFCEATLSREIVWHPGRQPIIIPQETKDYILGLFQNSFALRDQITAGQMDIALRRTTTGQFENEGTWEITVAFDEERQRVERRVVLKNNRYAGGQNIPRISIGCIGCYEGNNQLVVTYSQYVNPDRPNERSWLIVNDKGQQFEGEEWVNEWTISLGFIPRYIVYFGGSVDNRFPTQKTLAQAWDLLYNNSLGMLESGVTDVTILDVDYKGTKCRKVVFETKWDDGSVTRNAFWFAVEQGYALRKHHFQTGGSSPGDYNELLEVDVALDKDSGIWFPSAWRYVRTDGNGNPRVTEEGTITNVVLNKPIPERIFTMQDLKTIPAGIPVVWHTELVPAPHGAQRHGELLWDGNDIVTRGMFNEGLVAQMAAQHRSERFQTMILINVAVIGLILSIFFWRMYQRMKLQN